MANKKITELNAASSLAATDVVPVVDVSADETKKITATDLFRTLPDGTAAAPSLSFASDAGNGVFLAGTDTVGISTGGTQRVTVDGSGNVTISGDLTVSGAESFSVAHTADTDTAYVTVTVADDSMDNVSITVNDSIVDIAGNPLIEAVDNLQTVDTVNPEVTIADDQSGIAFDGANTVTYTLTFSEPVQQITESDLTVDGEASYTVDHTAGTDTAYVTVTVADNSMDNVSITVNDSIVDIAGNPLIEAVDNLQTVDTRNPSTVGAPAVSDVLVTDTDDGTTLTVTFGFDEAMDQGIAPDVTFDPAVASH